MTEATQVHVFERAGLGKAPFRFVGIEMSWYQPHPSVPKKPGSSCDFCGTGIAEVCWILSSDGKRFKVGNECVRRTGDAGLKKGYNREAIKASHEKADARVEAAKQLLASSDVPKSLMAFPHPFADMAKQGYTRLDYVTFLLENGGRAGKVKAARMVEAAHA